MNKKGELSINYIIMFIIALIVLVVIIIIFRSQLGFIIEQLTGLIKRIFLPLEGIKIG